MKKPIPKKPAKPPPPKHLADERTETQKERQQRFDRLKDVDL